MTYDTNVFSKIGGYYLIIGALMTLFVWAMPGASELVVPNAIDLDDLTTSGNFSTSTTSLSFVSVAYNVYTSMLTMNVDFTGSYWGNDKLTIQQKSTYDTINGILNLIFFAPLTFSVGWILLNRILDVAKDLVPL